MDTSSAGRTQNQQFFGNVSVDPVYFEFENNQLMDSKQRSLTEMTMFKKLQKHLFGSSDDPPIIDPEMHRTNYRLMSNIHKEEELEKAAGIAANQADQSRLPLRYIHDLQYSSRIVSGEFDRLSRLQG